VTEIRGFPVTAAGTYVLFEDVVAAIREYAQSLDDPQDGAAIHALAAWLSSGMEVEPQRAQDTAQALVEAMPPEVFEAEPDDVTNGVARVEIFPDNPDDPRPRWHARTIDTSGYIIKTTNGSFDQEWVIQNAQERFPGIEIYLLRHAGEDSKWTEDQHRGVFPSMGPPIRRMYGGLPQERQETGGYMTKVNA